MLAFLKGFLYFFESFTFLSRNSLWKDVIKTCIFSLMLGIVIFTLFYQPGVWLFDWLVEFYPWEKGKDILQTLSSVLLVIFLLVGFIISFRYITFIVLSPMMSIMARKVEYIASDGKSGEKKPRFSLIREVWRGFRINTRNLAREAAFGIVLAVIGLFPGLAIFAGPAFLIVQAFYIGFGSLDYYLEKYYNIKESVQLASKEKFWLTGVGFGYLILILVPILGIFLAPSMAVVASTRLAVSKGI